MEKQEKYLETDDQTRVIPSESALEEYFKFRQTHDITGGSSKFGEVKDGRVYTTECHALGVIDAPLFNSDIRKKEGFSDEELSDESFSEAASSNQYLMVIPIDDKLQVCAVRDNALRDVLKIAGCDCPMALTVAENRQRKPQAAEFRSAMVTNGLHAYKHKAHVLIRDGKLEHFKGPRYQVLPEWDGYHALKSYLDAEYPNNSYVSGEVSHEYLSVILDTGDDLACVNLKETLISTGYNATNVSLHLRYTTSEVGNAAMRVTPLFNIDGIDIPLAEGIEVRHDAGNSIDMLASKLPHIAEMAKEAEDAVEVLGNTDIKHLDGCFQRIADELNIFPVQRVNDKINELSLVGSGTAIDIYLSLIEVATLMLANKHDVGLYVRSSEAIAKTLHWNYKNFDKAVMDDED
jgi:hypothetical protein